MRLTRIIVLMVLVALAASSISVAVVRASGLHRAVINGCTVTAPKVSRPSDTIAVVAKCYKQGKFFTPVVSYSYIQTDVGGFTCGPAINKTGPSFTPRVANTFYAKVTYTVRAPSWVKGVKPMAPKTFLVTLGHWQTQCGKLVMDDLPTPDDLCGYKFVTNEGDACGSFISDDGYNGLHPDAPLPQQGSKPLRVGSTVYAPVLLSSGGRCTEEAQGPKFLWMGKMLQHAVFHCGKTMVLQTATVYYYPSSSGQLCTADEGNLPNDGYSHFTLPDDWQTWSGQLTVVFEALVFPPGQQQATLRNGRFYMPNREYASAVFNLSGWKSGCSELGDIQG